MVLRVVLIRRARHLCSHDHLFCRILQIYYLMLCVEMDDGDGRVFGGWSSFGFLLGFKGRDRGWAFFKGLFGVGGRVGGVEDWAVLLGFEEQEGVLDWTRFNWLKYSLTLWFINRSNFSNSFKLFLMLLFFSLSTSFFLPSSSLLLISAQYTLLHFILNLPCSVFHGFLISKSSLLIHKCWPLIPESSLILCSCRRYSC